MINYSPCMDIFFPELSFKNKIDAIAKLGYTNYEFWTWWDKDINEIQDATLSNNMNLLTFCTKFVSLVDASKRNEYLNGLGETIEASQKLGNKVIISQVGDELAGVGREAQKECLIEGLKASAELLKGTDLVLAVEPLNLLYDHEGYFLSRSDEAYEIINAVNSKNVKILFDIYHQQITEGNIINNIKKYFDQIAHFHMADLPGRGEIGTGEINYPVILKTIEALGFKGGVGIELFPKNENHSEVLGNKIFF